MNSFIRPEIKKLKTTSQTEIVGRLKNAVEKLLNHLSGKNREERLKALSTSSIKDNNEN